MKYTALSGLLALAIAVVARSQPDGIPIRGPSAPPGFKQALDQFNADVAAWNKRCRITRSDAEDAWCRKERARNDARRAELIAQGAIPR